MIYFIDEDVNENEPFRIGLNMKGYEVKAISTADEAYEILRVASDPQAIILDVMLASRGDKTSLFDPVTTQNYVVTGLTLLKLLVEDKEVKKRGKIPSRVILMSTVQYPEIVKQIQDVANEYGIPYLDKLDYDDMFLFAEKIDELVKKNA